MATYWVDVQDAKGKRTKAKVKAKSPTAAQRSLRGKYPKIGKAKKAGLDLEIDFSSLEERFSRVSLRDKAIFSRQFATMINAGVGIVRCLNVLCEQCSNPKLRKSLVAISEDVQQGVNLSEAMSKHPRSFDRLYVSMVEAGEAGGVLDEVLNRLAKLLEDMARLEGQIKSAMVYPLAVGLFAFAVFIGMTVFLIPIFAGIFEGLGVALPPLTQFMLDLSALLRSPRAIILVAVIGGGYLGFRQYYRTPTGRLRIDQLMLKLPLFGGLIEKNAVARFCRIFGTLTRSGVPILYSLDIVRHTAGNQVYANAIEVSKQEVQQGGMISLALQREKVFPPLAIQMMSIGEETGELDAMMIKVADFYEDEVEQTVKAITSLIEPVMMVGVAVIVGIILLAMYLPMFKVFDQLG
jgi:type IV pilus assembly protein PilC